MADWNPPWLQGPLREWSLVAMSHYIVSGRRYLFVAMVKSERYITESGPDDTYLWNRLWHKAVRDEELNPIREDRTHD